MEACARPRCFQFKRFRIIGLKSAAVGSTVNDLHNHWIDFSGNELVVKLESLMPRGDDA